MDPVTPERLFIIAAFLGCLLIIWVVVRLYRAPLAARLKQGKRLEVAEVATLGGDARAVLLTVDGTRVLIVSGRKTGTAIQALPDLAAPGDLANPADPGNRADPAGPAGSPPPPSDTPAAGQAAKPAEARP